MNDLPKNNSELNAEAAQNSNPSVTDGSAKEVFNLKKEIFEWFYTIAIALVIAFLIKGFLFDVVRVDGDSMKPTLLNNDRLIISKLAYTPEQKDIIILDSTYKRREQYYAVREQNGENINFVTKFLESFSLPQDLKKRYYVKRIIALPGQTVDIVDGKVLVDGEILEEEYYHGDTTITDPTVEYPITIDENHVFVMGDNRHNSSDSRVSTLGQVPMDAILGKAQIRIWPLNNIGLTK